MPPSLGAFLAIRPRMGFKSLGEVKAYRAARAFKLEIYRLVKSEPAAFNDFGYRSQIFDAAGSTEMNVAEGYRRYLAGEFTQFLRVARGSLGEAIGWVQDGIDRGYFTDAACEHARELGDEAGKLITGLIKSLKPFSKRSRKAKPKRPKPD